MNITITSEKLIKEIQEEFSAVFPFLRIEFFIKSIHKSREPIKKLSNLLTIGNALNVNVSTQIEISACMTVKEFENDFENKFGVYAQLYRKSGNLWQEITITDIWTLKQQDERGNEISTLIDQEIYTKPKRRKR